jgi:cytochrome c553
MKNWMQLLLLFTSISATSALLASGGMEEGGGAMPVVSNAKWAAECSSCHMLYHPGLLPERVLAQNDAGA